MAKEPHLLAYLCTNNTRPPYVLFGYPSPTLCGHHICESSLSDDEDSNGGGGLSGSGGSSQAGPAGDGQDDLERFNPSAPLFFRRKRNCQGFYSTVKEFWPEMHSLSIFWT